MLKLGEAISCLCHGLFICEYSLTIRQKSQNTQSCSFDLFVLGVLFCFEKVLCNLAKMTLNFWSSDFYFPSAEITGRRHHTRLLRFWVRASAERTLSPDIVFLWLYFHCAQGRAS